MVPGVGEYFQLERICLQSCMDLVVVLLDVVVGAANAGEGQSFERLSSFYTLDKNVRWRFCHWSSTRITC